MCPDSNLSNHNEILKMFDISVNFKDTKKAEHIFNYQLLEIEDDVQVVSQFLCLVRHLVSYINCLKIITVLNLNKMFCCAMLSNF